MVLKQKPLCSLHLQSPNSPDVHQVVFGLLVKSAQMHESTELKQKNKEL